MHHMFQNHPCVLHHFICEPMVHFYNMALVIHLVQYIYIYIYIFKFKIFCINYYINRLVCVCVCVCVCPCVYKHL